MGLRLGLGISLSTLALGLFSLCVSAQPATVGEPIAVGHRLQLRSASLGEVRNYQVHRPPGYDISNARYPVLIVLDGDEHFQHVSATVDFLSAAGKIPAMLVIGIPNTNRFEDMNSAAAPGSSPFLTFITDELVPTIDRDYRTRPYRILVGWSSAGVYTLYTMINAPGTFRGYIAIAPAFGERSELDMPETVAAFLESNQELNLNADVFMTVDNGTGFPLAESYELSSYLQMRAQRKGDLRFTFRRYSESHMVVPLLSVYEGLLSIFDGWETDAFALYELGGLAAIDRHYAALSERLGYTVPVPEHVLINTFGQLESRRFPEAEQVIKRAIESYPESPIVFFYAGRLYIRMGNNSLALETVKQGLLLSPNNSALRSLLNRLNVAANDVVPEVRVRAQDLSKFVGGYGTSTVVFEVEQRGDKIFGKTPEAEYVLDALSGTMFNYSDRNIYTSGGVVSFRTDDRGRVIGLVFQNGGAELAKLR